ncbi:uncharacterized protein LOC107037512 [Diachasma alloeum]|uniref:uncharacterized protein LOC107037512 n=1 Tax=Diachasma alloeum TaxID=454923 RepID=UPI00073814F0|nr:uncharacterized protein LOC107037512 [Diachasma alloeum]
MSYNAMFRRATRMRRASGDSFCRMRSAGVTGPLITKDEVVRFVAECMQRVGTDGNHSKIVAHHLMTADYRGHFSHGMNRMPMYVRDIESKRTDPHGEPKIINDFQATALVDGQNGLGQVIGKFSMELAIKKAKTFGIGMVSARGSNHYGICGYYSLMATDECLIGFTCTNTSPLLVPTRSTTASLGTNPLSLAMKTHDARDEFVLDMATTAVALGKIEVAVTKGQEIPEGWALGKDGKVTKNPAEAYETTKLMPLGGSQENSGYKGYGLATMVEVLCGVLSGSHFGKNIRRWKEDDRIANLGHCFMAIDPKVFAPGAGERLGQLLGELRELPTADGDEGVLVAGDPERKAMRRVDQEGGIRYHENQIKICDGVAKKLGVTPLRSV